MAISRRHFGRLLFGLSASDTLKAATPGSFSENFSDLRLVDQDGRTFRFDAQPGQVLLVNFVFTGCSTVCPVQTRALVELQAALPATVGRAVHFVSVSLDPASDTPAALKAFAARMGADLRHWSFVTGSTAGIASVSDRLRLFRSGAEVRKPDDHSTSLWLVDRQGRLVQRLHGNPLDAHRLAAELTTLTQL